MRTPLHIVPISLFATSIAISIATMAVAQDANEPESTEQNTEEAADRSAATEDDAEEVVVDDESYLDIDEKDFKPSEEIGSDQSISFPTDI